MKCLLHVEHSAGTNRRVSAPVDLTDHRMSDIIYVNTLFVRYKSKNLVMSTVGEDRQDSECV